MKSGTVLILLASTLLSPNDAAGQGSGFRAGDLFLLTSAYGGAAAFDARLVRIDPFTGQANTLVDCTAISQFTGALAYDAFRDRLVFLADIGAGLIHLNLTDGAGVTQDLGYGGSLLANVTPAAGGKIYFQNYTVNGQTIFYLDASNVQHTLMMPGPTGPIPFVLAPAQTVAVRGMIYHPAVNALFCASQSFNNAPCAGGSADDISVRRIPLSADGSLVIGPVTCAQFDAAPGEALEYPVGWSLGPNGKLMLVVDNTTNLQQPRMVLVDPVTLAMSPFASNGPYVGAEATLAGTYSRVLGRAVVLDSGNDVLRSFGPGEVGGGTAFAAGVSWALWTSEFANLIEIGPATGGSGLSANVGTISVAAGGTHVLSLALGASHAGETYAVAGSATSWWPGFVVGSFLIPLTWDFYTDYSLANANGPILQNTVGALGASGQATAQFVFTPNMVPGIAGLTIYHAAAALNGGLALTAVTNPVPLTFIP